MLNPHTFTPAKIATLLNLSELEKNMTQAAIRWTLQPDCTLQRLIAEEYKNLEYNAYIYAYSKARSEHGYSFIDFHNITLLSAYSWETYDGLPEIETRIGRMVESFLAEGCDLITEEDEVFRRV